MDVEALLNQVRTHPNIAAAFYHLASVAKSRTIFEQAELSPSGARTWRSTSYTTVAAQVSRLARYLHSIGVTRGTRVAVMSNTRPEWMIADMAIHAAGGTCVSIYQSISRDETGYILFDSGAKVVFAENEEQVEKLRSLLASPCPVPATELHAAQDIQIELSKIITFEETSSHPLVTPLSALLSDESLSPDPPEFFSVITPEDLASLVYTSGTTGPPKGVMQTHGNHLANVWQASRCGAFAPEGSIFLFLPLAHSFARLIGYIGFLTPTLLKFPAITDRTRSGLNASAILADLRDSAANVFPTVPRILEKMAAGVQEKATKGGLGGALLSLALRNGERVSRRRREGKYVFLSDRVLHALLAPIRLKISTTLFGTNFHHIVSGGAKLPVSVGAFFESIGVTTLEGYGLTETCVATNVNRPNKKKLGSVGPLFEEVELKITPEGEILFRGPNITKGYFNRPEATKASWDDEGWFHTGDLGRLDEEGFLFITGRKKELIVTAGGKKVAPSPIEEKLVASPYISHALIVGDGKPYCAALFTIERPQLEAWARGKQRALSLTDPEVLSLFQADLDRVNATLSKFETIKKFRIIEEEFTVENGFLTPTFKVKRAMIEKRYKDLIEAMYAEGGVKGE